MATHFVLVFVTIRAVEKPALDFLKTQPDTMILTHDPLVKSVGPAFSTRFNLPNISDAPDQFQQASHASRSAFAPVL